MNKLYLALIAVFVFGASTGVAFSQTGMPLAIGHSGSSSGASAGSESTSGAIAGAQAGALGVGGSSGSSSSANASPTIVVGSGNTYEAMDLGDTVPTMFIPNLTTSNGTCMGSFSSGVTVSGFGGGFGKTYTSQECNARFNANQILALGQKGLAMEIMCGLESVYEADQRMARPMCKPHEEASTDPVATSDPTGAPVTTERVTTWFPIDQEDIDVGDGELAMFEGSMEPIIWGGDYPEIQGNR